jgi:ParB family chromosome partitioning protein
VGWVLYGSQYPAVAFAYACKGLYPNERKGLVDPNSMLAQHSSSSVEHYTPHQVVDAARATMGHIDLDPASCELANTIVGADYIYTEAGLEKPWYGNVFLNPPGGRGQAVMWWKKLLNEWSSGRVKQAVFVGFTLELLQTTQRDDCTSILDYAFCVPAKRLRFLKPVNGVLEPGDSPTHANVICYLGDNESEFDLYFSPIGQVSL